MTDANVTSRQVPHLPGFRPDANAAITFRVGRTIAAVLREHIQLLALLGAYFLGVTLLMMSSGQWHHWTIRWGYWLLWSVFLVSVVVVVIADGRFSQPERIGGALLVTALAGPFQSTFNSVKQLIDDVRG